MVPLSPDPRRARDIPEVRAPLGSGTDTRRLVAMGTGLPESRLRRLRQYISRGSRRAAIGTRLADPPIPS